MPKMDALTPALPSPSGPSPVQLEKASPRQPASTSALLFPRLVGSNVNVFPNDLYLQSEILIMSLLYHLPSAPILQVPPLPPVVSY